MVKIWTDEHLQFISRLIADYVRPYEDIAAEVTRTFGIPATKSTICSLVYRYHLPWKTPCKASSVQPLPRRPTMSLATIHAFVELTHCQCRFELSRQHRPEFFRFCGAETRPGRPFCTAHMKLVYEKRTKK